MRRYWLPDESFQDDQVLIEGESFHHIHDVCRMGPGSRFEVLSKGGQAHFVQVTEVGKKRMTAQILESRTIPPLPKPYIHLVLSIPKFPTFEGILEKAVELGVRSILPVTSDFSFVRKNLDPVHKKWPRWQKIIQGATQQTGRGDWLELRKPQALVEFLRGLNRDSRTLCLFAYEGTGQLSLRQALGEVQRDVLEDVYLVIGSEGGFSDQEVALFQQAGWPPISLGEQVLRVETACLAAISVIKYELDLMNAR